MISLLKTNLEIYQEEAQNTNYAIGDDNRPQHECKSVREPHKCARYHDEKHQQTDVSRATQFPGPVHLGNKRYTGQKRAEVAHKLNPIHPGDLRFWN
jgi:hypothetical protein